MPLHDLRCRVCGRIEERHISLNQLGEIQLHYHGADVEVGVMDIVYLKAPMVFVQPDICYDSPIDGRPITSKQARIEDLARSNCQPYDPEMKRDAERRRKEGEARLEKAVDETVEAEFDRMPIRKKEKLAAELEGGMTAEPVRLTAPTKPIRTELHNG